MLLGVGYTPHLRILLSLQAAFRTSVSLLVIFFCWSFGVFAFLLPRFRLPFSGARCGVSRLSLFSRILHLARASRGRREHFVSLSSSFRLRFAFANEFSSVCPVLGTNEGWLFVSLALSVLYHGAVVHCWLGFRATGPLSSLFMLTTVRYFNFCYIY